jgi:hypothetical protein
VRAARRAAAVLAFAAAFLVLGAQPAFAAFHEILIREVYPGYGTGADSEYVELQMFSPGQNLVNGHGITVHDAAGKQVAKSEFSSTVSSGANQATIVIATPAAEAQFGIAADFALSPAGMMDPTGGAVCWDGTPDCMSWGNFSGSTKSPAGSPAAPGGIPEGQALRRTIAPGCASLLEASDDRNNSAADFDVVFPAPRPNSVPPTEKACTSQGGGDGPGGGGSKGDQPGPPQTTLNGKPAKRTRDRTPTFRFRASESGSAFQCKLDRKPFRACRAPFTTKKLSFGKHTFKVRARDDDGVDPSPASFSFTVLKPR